jgi:hypothetical protein
MNLRSERLMPRHFVSREGGVNRPPLRHAYTPLRCYSDVMEGRGDSFKRLNPGRSIAVRDNICFRVISRPIMQCPDCTNSDFVSVKTSFRNWHRPVSPRD